MTVSGQLHDPGECALVPAGRIRGNLPLQEQFEKCFQVWKTTEREEHCVQMWARFSRSVFINNFVSGKINLEIIIYS